MFLLNTSKGYRLVQLYQRYLKGLFGSQQGKVSITRQAIYQTPPVQFFFLQLFSPKLLVSLAEGLNIDLARRIVSSSKEGQSF